MNTKDIMARLFRSALLLVALLLAVCVTFPGCSGALTPEQIDAYKTAVNDTKARADTYSADANQKLKEVNASLEVDPEDADLLKLKAEYTKAVEAASQMQKAAQAADLLLKESLNPDGSPNIAGSMAAAATLVPPPWNGVLMVGGPLVALAVGEYRRRRDLGNLVDALEAAKAKDAELVGALKRNKATMLDVMSDGVYSFVEKRKE